MNIRFCFLSVYENLILWTIDKQTTFKHFNQYHKRKIWYIIRRVASVLSMWKHFQAGGLGPPWGPQWVQGEALVGAQRAKPPEANGFYTFTVQFSILEMTLSSIFFCLWFYPWFYMLWQIEMVLRSFSIHDMRRLHCPLTLIYTWSIARDESQVQGIVDLKYHISKRVFFAVVLFLLYSVDLLKSQKLNSATSWTWSNFVSVNKVSNLHL